MRESDIVVLVLGVPLLYFIVFWMSGDLWRGIFRRRK